MSRASLRRKSWSQGVCRSYAFFALNPAHRRVTSPVSGWVTLAATGGPEGVQHPAAADHVGVGVETVHPVEAQREVAGQVDPEGDLRFLAGGGIGGGELPQELLRPEVAEELRLHRLARGLEVVELALPAAGQDKALVVLVADEVHYGASRRPASRASMRVSISAWSLTRRARARRKRW